MRFWDSLTAAVRAVPPTDGVAFEAVATFVLPAAPPLAALRAGGDPAEAIRLWTIIFGSEFPAYG